MHHALRGGQHTLTLRRQADKHPATVDDGGAKLLLQRPQRIGQRWLRDMASQRCSAKMLVLI